MVGVQHLYCDLRCYTLVLVSKSLRILAKILLVGLGPKKADLVGLISAPFRGQPGPNMFH